MRAYIDNRKVVRWMRELAASEERLRAFLGEYPDRLAALLRDTTMDTLSRYSGIDTDEQFDAALAKEMPR